jgi:hypothetical protein
MKKWHWIPAFAGMTEVVNYENINNGKLGYKFQQKLLKDARPQ